MSEVPEAVAGAIEELVDAVGLRPATLEQDGQAHEISLAVTGRRRAPDGGSVDREELFALLPAAGAAVAPKADATVEIGDERWAVTQAQPVAPGGEVVAWRLSMRSWTERVTQ